MITINNFQLSDLYHIKKHGGNMKGEIDDYECSNYVDENMLLVSDFKTGEIVAVIDISNKKEYSNNLNCYKPWKNDPNWGNSIPDHW